MHTGFVTNTVQRALKKAKPNIMNSDQGCRFTSGVYTGLLKENASKTSMNGKGRALDNIITEPFSRTLKTEGLYLRDHSCNELVRSLKQMVPHARIGMWTSEFTSPNLTEVPKMKYTQNEKTAKLMEKDSNSGCGHC